MLQINNLCMSAGNFSVDDITISIPEGGCHTLLGGTGNGKTLILETIAGLRPIKSGQIWTGDFEITNEPPEKRSISYVPQDLALFPHLTVEQNILYSQRFKRSSAYASQDIAEIIKYLNLENILRRSIHNLSGGERQRVALARAFATGNKVMLLDEPFSALHYTMKRSLWHLLFDMQNKYNLAILMVTHDLEEASFLADYISVLHQGKVLQTGTKKEVFYKPNCIEVTNITGHYNYLSGKVSISQGNECLIYCESLDCNFSANCTGLALEEEVVIAIRINDVELINDSCNERVDGPNRILCKIKTIHDTSHSRQLVLEPEQQLHNPGVDIIVDIENAKNTRISYASQNLIAYFPHDAISVFRKSIND